MVSIDTGLVIECAPVQLSMSSISGYINVRAFSIFNESQFDHVIVSFLLKVTKSLDLEPPLAYRRWFAEVSNGSFSL